MQANKRKAIAEQSRSWLMESLVRLMSKKDYNQITVTEISDNALLSRRTFYRNFNSKEDILEAYCHNLCQDYMERLNDETDLSLSHITKVYFSFWQKHIEFLRILDKNHMLFFLLEKYNEFLPVIYQIYKGKDNDFGNESETAYGIRFSAGGFWNLLSQWLKSDIAETPIEMSFIVSKSMRAFIDNK